MITTAWGIVTPTGELCCAFVRQTRREAIKAQINMFGLTDRQWRRNGYRSVKLKISYGFKKKGRE